MHTSPAKLDPGLLSVVGEVDQRDAVSASELVRKREEGETITTIAIVAGARPNFMKIAPLIREFRRNEVFETKLIHTGQHYDNFMSEVFFEDLGMRTPDYSLGAGSGTHAEQTAAVMLAFERLCIEARPDLAMVVGDVNSTLACAIAARKLNIPIAHVEAGLRSRDWKMPEEVNRVLTDAVSDYLFTPSHDADDNLRREGVSEERIFRVGNIMIDSLVFALERAPTGKGESILANGVRDFGLVTLHRPSNVDDPHRLVSVIETLRGLDVPLVFPVHPRTRARIERQGLSQDALGKVRLVEPLGYFDFVGLMKEASFVVTDSGGIQEETTYLQIPCITLRDQTERPVTVELGSNELGTLDSLPHQVDRIRNGKWKAGAIPQLWDGKTATRVVGVLERGVQGLL